MRQALVQATGSPAGDDATTIVERHCNLCPLPFAHPLCNYVVLGTPTCWVVLVARSFCPVTLRHCDLCWAEGQSGLGAPLAHPSVGRGRGHYRWGSEAASLSPSILPSQYVGGRLSGPSGSIYVEAEKIWSVNQNNSFRTNNHLEGWHNRLKRVIGKAHPNVYEFVEVIQKEQTATEVFLTQLEAGAF